MCNITKKIFFGGVKILPNVANNKDKKKNYKLYKLLLPNSYSVSSVVATL